MYGLIRAFAYSAMCGVIIVAMLKIDDRQIKDLVGQLATFNRRALPHATKATVNGAAFKGQQIAREEVRTGMINRNRFTIQSIQVEQTRTLDVARQEAALGSTQGYMEKQEFGGFKNRTGKEGVAIPTQYSAGQGMGAQPRTRLPRKPNKIQNIRLKTRGKKGATRQQRNIVAIKLAATSGDKFVFLDLGRKKGIFKVIGGKRKPQIRMVYDMSEPSVRIPRKPWLKPSSDKTVQYIPEIYFKALTFQLNRLNLFKNKS